MLAVGICPPHFFGVMHSVSRLQRIWLMRKMGERRRYKKRHSSDNLLNRSKGRTHRQLARRSTFYLSESFVKNYCDDRSFVVMKNLALFRLSLFFLIVPFLVIVDAQRRTITRTEISTRITTVTVTKNVSLFSIPLYSESINCLRF